ncbi:ABC transporter ATP-binding protein [Nocardioides xinjiangensis]|uniref:ABC transporter ATP-binding protein n=1 Tax=Nocardioides xinjiangensis TaxID=2817376 RepID=UPI001B30ABC9|nr:ABC transporter ATP-binding protein [Nocardioides sp. SYSU D00514]
MSTSAGSVHLVRRALALFDASTTRRFFLAIAGSVVVALGEVLALLLVLPLMQLITGDTAAGALPRLRELLGSPDDSRLAIYLSSAVIGGFIAKSLVALAIRWWTSGFVLRRGAVASSALMRYYLNAPYSLHVQRGAADLLRRMSDAMAQVFDRVLNPAISLATELVTIAAMATTLLVVAPVPTLAVTIYFGLAAYLLQRLVRERMRRSGQELMTANLEILRYALQALSGIKEIQLRNDQEVFVQRYEGARLRAAMEHRTMGFISELPKYAMEILFIGAIGIMTALSFALESRTQALGVLALFAVAGFRVLPSCVRSIASLSLLRSGEEALDLVEEDSRAAHRTLVEVTGAHPAALPLNDALTVRDLTFQYPDADAPVLVDVNLTIPAGSSLALVGRSGSGKSTLVDLILGLQRPTAGVILADSVDIGGALKAWQAGLSMVPQDVYLLEGSIRDNVYFTPGVDDPGDARLHAAIEQASLADLISELPDGVETEVGDRGTRLSGGQRQRVGLARALFRSPHLLVLDEATSALDNETEHEVSRTIRELHGRITTILVAHRLSTVKHCDQVAFLEGGRVSAIGTFDELKEKSPAFARLVALGSLDSGLDATSPGTAR